MCLADFARLSVLYCISPADLFMSLLSSADSKFPDFPFVRVISLLFWHTHKKFSGALEQESRQDNVLDSIPV